MASDSLANLSREELVSRVQQAEQLVSVANDSLSYLRMTSSHSPHCVKACAVVAKLASNWAACVTTLLLLLFRKRILRLYLQFQQEQRRSNSLNDELKAAKEQNVLVVGVSGLFLLP